MAFQKLSDEAKKKLKELRRKTYREQKRKIKEKEERLKLKAAAQKSAKKNLRDLELWNSLKKASELPPP